VLPFIIADDGVFFNPPVAGGTEKGEKQFEAGISARRVSFFAIILDALFLDGPTGRNGAGFVVFVLVGCSFLRFPPLFEKRLTNARR